MGSSSPSVLVLLNEKKWIQMGSALKKILEMKGITVFTSFSDFDAQVTRPSLIVHKLLDPLAAIKFNHSLDSSAEKDTLTCLEKYVSQFPDIILIDHLKYCDILLSRIEMADYMERACKQLKHFAETHEYTLQIPAWMIVSADVPWERVAQFAASRYPIIAKPDVAGCLSFSHHMFILSDKAELERFFQTSILNGIKKSEQRWIFQKFIPHRLFLKVYVINSKSYAIVKEFCPKDIRRFDTQASTSPSPVSKFELLPDSVTEGITQTLSRIFNLTLFGYDLIVDQADCFLIDVNYFPSYKYLSLDPNEGASLIAEYLHGRVMDSMSNHA